MPFELQENTREVMIIASELEAALTEVRRLEKSLLEACARVADQRPAVAMVPPPALTLPGPLNPVQSTPSDVEHVEGLVDFDPTVFDRLPPRTSAVTPPTKGDAGVLKRPPMRDRMAKSNTKTNQILRAIAAAGRALSSSAIHEALGGGGDVANTQSTVQNMHTYGFLTREGPRSARLWGVAPGGVERLKRMGFTNVER